MQLFVWLNQRLAEKALTQRMHLQANTDILYIDLDSMHQEIVETVEEMGHKIFVGATAKFDTNWHIQPLKSDRVNKFGYTRCLSIIAEIESNRTSTHGAANSNTLRSVHVLYSDQQKQEI
jgi:hypothetical protein